VTVLYSVYAEFERVDVAEEWIAWLTGGHLAEVIADGALDATVVRLEGEPLSCAVHYRFASRESLAVYERDSAPRLRAEGMAKFPPERGVRYRRTIGAIVAERPGQR
jgi:hypothetical protein